MRSLVVTGCVRYLPSFAVLLVLGLIAQLNECALCVKRPIECLDEARGGEVLSDPFRKRHVLSGVANASCELRLTETGCPTATLDLSCQRFAGSTLVMRGAGCFVNHATEATRVPDISTSDPPQNSFTCGELAYLLNLAQKSLTASLDRRRLHSGG